jgi:CheY-like chemotaxis protein
LQAAIHDFIESKRAVDRTATLRQAVLEHESSITKSWNELHVWPSACTLVEEPIASPMTSLMANFLIVDDDPDLADLLAEVLRAKGHECEVAHDGREGLARVRSATPDLVLVDVEMPILNGPDMAYQMFLRNCGDERIPVVLISGIVGLPDIAAAVGTPYFLAKPYTVSSVLHLVARALEERRLPHPTRNG